MIRKAVFCLCLIPGFVLALKWHDGYEGHGEHYFDYNHVGPKEVHHAAPAYAPPKPSYGGPALTNKREADQPTKRVRRDAPPAYGAPPSYAPEPVYHAPKHHGRVGPVYTFVKTDPQANFKWGVRHRAGSQYGR